LGVYFLFESPGPMNENIRVGSIVQWVDYIAHPADDVGVVLEIDLSPWGSRYTVYWFVEKTDQDWHSQNQLKVLVP